METFKKALKQAILDKSEAVRFEESHKPQLMLYSAERPLEHLPEQPRSEVLQLIDSLLPISQSPTGQVREGVLSIVNFGELKLLASTGETARLFAFIPPQGNQIYQQIKNILVANGMKPLPKPIQIAASEELPPFARSEQAGHFAMGSVTGQGTLDGLTNPAKTPSTTDDSTGTVVLTPQTFGLSAPPLPKANLGIENIANTQLRPRFEKPIPVDFGSDTSSGTLIDHAKAEQLDQSTVVSKKTPSPLFPKEENTDAEDYHFNQSIHSMSRGPNDFTNTFAAIHAPVPDPQPLPLPPPEQAKPEVVETTKPVAAEAEKIYFGSTIPGDSIERNGPLPIDSMLEDMVHRRASDLHLTLSEQACMRIDGEIVRVGQFMLTEEQMKSFILPIMPPKNRQEFARHHDTDFAYEIPGIGRFRVNVFRDRMGVGAVLRQIPEKVLTADDLSLPPAVRKLCELHKGLVVVTGPTGSGKSTTLAAMIDLINETRNDHILTIEDPIEFVHKQKRCLVNQREVFKHTQSFSRALRAALREDPDIIMIGEMRDLETVEIAIETAETGHLVFGTLHTNTAISTVDRLIDQFPHEQQEQVRVMLAESLRGVVAQTLVKKKGGGRIAAHEILIVDKAVASLIREGNTHMVQNHMQTQKAKGNCTLNDALLSLVTRGLVEARDAYAKSIEKEAFANMLQQKGITLDPTAKTA